MSRVRIALLTYSTRPRGGVVHTLALAEALARAGEEVAVWSLARGGDAGFFRLVDPRVRVHLVPLAEVEGEGAGQRVLRSVRVLGAAFAAAGQRYQIVHAQDCISANAVPGCIRTVHHLDSFSTPELVACHERAIRDPVAHVCVSASVAAELAAGWGVTATVIPNGVDGARFAAAASTDPGAAAARRVWQRRLGRYLLAVGGVEPRKGTLDLLEAYAQLARPGLALVLAGGATLFDYRDYRASFQARAAELGVAPVELGQVDDSALPALVAAAQAFAFASTKEGFGLAAMEALAAGVPLVARDLPVLREVFDGAALFATDQGGFAAALAEALDRPDPARRRRGEALAAAHTWERSAQAHRALYRRLLDQGVGRRAALVPAPRG